jgi:hypothetical protein
MSVKVDARIRNSSKNALKPPRALVSSGMRLMGNGNVG